MAEVMLHHFDNAFTQGGNRLCFFHPDDHHRCLKVIRPDRTPELRRQQKKFPKNVKPLSRFDENKNELLEMARIQYYIGSKAFAVIPRCFGMVKTDLGDALCSEMITDADGKVSLSLKQYLWVNGKTESFSQALKVFSACWQDLGMPSRDLLLHNIVVQQDVDQQGQATIKRLVVIDGLGWAGFGWLYYFFNALGQAKARKKIAKLDKTIEQLLVKKNTQSEWGYHGWLEEEQRMDKHKADKNRTHKKSL